MADRNGARTRATWEVAEAAASTRKRKREVDALADGLDPALLDRDATRDGLADASHMDAEL